MDAETFKRRVTVGVLLVGLILVGWGALSAAEWMASAMQVVKGASDVHSSVR